MSEMEAELAAASNEIKAQKEKEKEERLKSIRYVHMWPLTYPATLSLSLPFLFHQGRIYSFGEEGMQLSKFFSVTIFRTHSIGSIGMHARANLGYVAIFSNAEKFRCLYSYYGSCTPKEYICP